MRAAYGDATAQIFLISAAIGVVALVAVLFIKEKPLRRTVDIRPDADSASRAGYRRRAQPRRRPPARERTTPALGPGADVDDIDREFVEVLRRQRSSDSGTGAVRRQPPRRCCR